MKPRFPPQAMARFQHEHAILDALQRVEAARCALQQAANDLDRLIQRDPDGEWPKRWGDFLAAGGVTVDELCRWMVERQPIRAVNKQNQHLRLVSQASPWPRPAER